MKIKMIILIAEALKKIGISLVSDNKNDLLEKIKNLTLKNNEARNQIKEMNVQRNNYLNILKNNKLLLKNILKKWFNLIEINLNNKYNNNIIELKKKIENYSF